MKLALLNGDRFSPWHFQGYRLLDNEVEITAFRAAPACPGCVEAQADGPLPFAVEPIHFDTQAGEPVTRFVRRAQTAMFNREPRIRPFWKRLQPFDVIQSWELFSDWSEQALLARQAFGRPLVVMVWDNIPFNMERNPVRRGIKQRVAAGADVFVVHTERSRYMLDFEKVPRDRIVKVNPGVDTDLFAPGPSEREAFGLDEDAFVVLFASWFLPRKGIDFLILALRELLNDSSFAKHNIRLLAVGSGSGRERVQRLVDRLNLGGHCLFHGAAAYSEMPRAFRAADVLALPSIATPEWQEQCGMALIEAMSCGIPVVTTLSGAIPEIVGDAGLLCQPNDFVSLLDALKRLIRNPGQRQELAAAGRARALERFNLEQFAASMRDVYGQLL